MLQRDPQPQPAILIVDDDPVLLSLMQDSLENDGYRVWCAENGVEAVDIAVARAPALLIVDAVMPEMDGFELCRSLRRRGDTRQLPILMATGLDQESAVEDAYDAGATDFISKPFNLFLLNQRVRYMLRAAHAFEDLKRSQDNLLAAKNAAEAANRAKSEFLANMGHELRTPLNAIVGFTHILGASDVVAHDARCAEYLSYIASSGANLLANVENVLEFAKIEAGGMALDVEPFDLGETAMRSLHDVRGMARDRNIEIAHAIEPKLPPFLGEERRVRQILVNLLSNAVKFSHDGGAVSVAVRRNAAGEPELTIADAGIGIAIADMTRALAPFGQADTGLGRRYDGLGLGLPLTERLIGLHDGSLTLDAHKGGGTIATVRFPPARFLAQDALVERV